MDLSPLFYQCIVTIAPILAGFSVGGAVTYPSVLMEKFRIDNSTTPLDVHTKSWIGSIYGISGIPVILIPMITQRIGRKFGFLLSCLFVLTGWVLTYMASSATTILISQSFHGFGVNSLLPISFLSMSEMLAPRYRFASMQLYGIAQGLGMATTGILGRFYHFKTISTIMVIPITIAIIMGIMWPESPSWLAWKGEFNKCETTFIKLRGMDKTSAKELSDLITAQKEILSRKPSQPSLNDLWRRITSKDFYMPTFHIFIILNTMYWSGCDVVIIYFIEMASKSASSENATLYSSIIMYIIIVIGLCVTNPLVRRFENKSVLLTSNYFVVFFLLCTSIVTGLQRLEILSKDSILCVICLLLCVTSGACGVDSLVFVLSGELMPVKHRSVGGALYILLNCSLYAASQKLSPYLILYIDMWGTFFLYTINGFFCGLFIWKYVPETRGRSLQEIEDYYMYGKFIDRSADDLYLEDKELL